MSLSQWKCCCPQVLVLKDPVPMQGEVIWSPGIWRMTMFLSRLAVSREHSCPQADGSSHVPKQAEDPVPE